MMTLKDIVVELWPLHRTLASDGTDQALGIIGKHLPVEANFTIETYAPGQRAWTWQVPERYVVEEAYLEIADDGRRIVDFKKNPLHLVSYSVPVDRVLTWQDLEPHLYYSNERPEAIPWEFKYYQRNWGFCLSRREFEKLSRDVQYHAVIRSKFVTDPDQGFRVGIATVHPQTGQCAVAGTLLINAHICHPYQANDDIAGVVTALEVARRLSQRPLPPGSMSVRFLFAPETIGSICYLSHHEDLIAEFKGAMFCEMTGNRNSLVLQHSRQDNHLIDRIAQYVLNQQGKEFRQGAFREVICNDEMVINGPGVDIPCISISRWPYDEYHTSDDNPDIIHEDMLVEAADVVEKIVRIFASNYIPRRTFRGPVFLSGYDLWVDWRVNKDLNRALEQIMLHFEGKESVFDIAEMLNLNYQDVWQYVNQFAAHGLVQTQSIPSNSEPM
jgi:aminopeptidase-like protein